MKRRSFLGLLGAAAAALVLSPLKIFEKTHPEKLTVMFTAWPERGTTMYTSHPSSLEVTKWKEKNGFIVVTGKMNHGDFNIQDVLWDEYGNLYRAIFWYGTGYSDGPVSFDIVRMSSTKDINKSYVVMKPRQVGRQYPYTIKESFEKITAPLVKG